MRTSKRVVLFCVLFLIFLSFKPLQAYDISLFSGLEVANSQNPPGAKVFAIKENSPPLQSDLRINDVITSIEGQPVSSLEDFVRISTALKDKESVSLSVHRWGKVYEIVLGKKSVGEQAKPETRAQAEPPPKQIEAKTAQKGFENPVVPNATGITYRHGQYPSEGNNTHPGIDIVADCGSPIYAFADGQVTNLIKDEKDPHFKSLGYMVIIKHLEPINSKDTYSIYLHMEEPPAVSKGQTVKAGDVIGKVGDTGKVDGCHVHFELRHFPDRFLNDKGWNYPLNIYGKGDQRNEKRFLENWEDPEVYFRKYPGGIVSQEKKPQPEAPKVADARSVQTGTMAESPLKENIKTGKIAKKPFRNYYPLEEGIMWKYKTFVEEPFRRAEEKIIITNSTKRKLRGEEVIPQIIEYTSSMIQFIGEDESGIFVFAMQKSTDVEPEIEPNPVYILRYPLQVGTTWEGGDNSIEDVEEVVTVPAGTFKGCLKVKSGKDYCWYAPGIGMVRMISREEGKRRGFLSIRIIRQKVVV